MYETVMRNTCLQWNMEYKVTMSKDVWDNIYTYYNTFDSNGNIVKRSIIKECVDNPTNSSWRDCYFILGKLSADQCAEHHMEDQNCFMETAGWLNAPGAYGQRGAKGTWAWPPED